MRILIVTFEFPPGLGGAGTYAYHMAKAFSRMGHEVMVAANSKDATTERVRNFDARLSFKTVRYKTCRNKVSKIIHRTRLTRSLILGGNFDVLLIPYPNAGFLGYWSKKRLGIPYAMTAHGTEFATNGVLVTRVLRMVYANADLALPNSEHTQKLMASAGVACPDTRVIPLGADPTVYDFREQPPPEGLEEKYNAEGRKIILTVGGLRRIKGHLVVIEAVEKLRDEFPEILYLIVGNGPEEAALRARIAEKGLEGHVRLEGFAEWDVLREYYALCDVFVLNSTMESFGIVLVEAGLMGKPVIASNVGGIPEVIRDGETGVLVPAEDSEATAEAVRHLFKHKDVSETMGMAGYRRAKSAFTWGHVARRTESALQDIVRGGK